MWLAMYKDTYMMVETTMSSSPLSTPIKTSPALFIMFTKTEHLSGSVQPPLDILMDKLDQVSTNLTNLPVSQVFPGELCAAKFTSADGMYSARVIKTREQEDQ